MCSFKYTASEYTNNETRCKGGTQHMWSGVHDKVDGQHQYDCTNYGRVRNLTMRNMRVDLGQSKLHPET